MSVDPFDGLLDREEVLSGLPARRANTLLFLIESRTAHLVGQSRQAMERFLTAEAAKEREIAFLEAFALGREPPLRPTIQDLERYAPQWANLVAKNPRVQAAVAHRLGEKYRFSQKAVPGIRAALGLDDPAIQQAYRRLYQAPLESIYSPSAALADRFRWAWAALARWLENLPPFWTAYSLTLTETVGATILALPIALAGIGPLAGVVFLIVLGLVNILTIALMAEAVARSGTIRYGSAFIGRAVADYLGRGGSLILTVGLFAICFLVLQAYYIGLSTTLQDATRVPAVVWVALLFLIGLYYLRRESLNATVASALVVGAMNISLIVALSLLALGRLQLDNLLYVNVPFLGGRPFEPSILGLVFGVILAAYFGHLSVSNCARAVLHRDPTARSLLWGTVAAQASALVLYSLFVVAVNGTIAPAVLAREPGTALAPLATEFGPLVHLLGSLFVVLGMGMASIHFSLALFNLTREWLPSQSQPVVVLPRRRGRLLLQERGRRRGTPLHIGFGYLGLRDGQPQFRLDVSLNENTYSVETTITGRWEILGEAGSAALLERFPALRSRDIRLALDVLDAEPQSARLRVASSMSLSYEGQWDVTGLSLRDITELPDAQVALVGWMMREGEVTVRQVAEHTGQDEGTARTTLAALTDQGLVTEVTLAGESRYVARLAPRQGRQLPQEIWQALDVEEDSPASTSSSRLTWPGSLSARLQQRLFGPSGRFVLGAGPVAAAFLLTEWLLITGSGSYAGLLSFIGVFVVSLLAGIFPVLLLVSSRRKGDYVPATVYRLLGNPVLLTGVYVLSLGSIYLHGLVIWDNPIQRAGALVVGTLILVMTIVMLRRGAFARRVIIELRAEQGQGDQALFAITAAGQAAVSDVLLEYRQGQERYQAAAGVVPAFSSLCRARFKLGWGGDAVPRELKAWAHVVTPTGDSETMPALFHLHHGDETKQFDLRLTNGIVLLPLTHPTFQVDIAVAEPDGGRLDR